jgi:2-polyprenyl-6-methoxyphenol hydroxylase-like FAD-dependent oxidoreductase
MTKVRSITIVGGGSSGWMAAAYLSQTLLGTDITLIESKTVHSIGVGEATTPALTRLMKRLGFPQWESWLPECDGTLKTGIRFENWHQKGDMYWHPFEALDYVDDHHHTGHCWLTLRNQGDPRFQQRSSFYNSFFVSTLLNCRDNKGPVTASYAFHFNADLFGEFLRKACRGVRHILDDVMDVKIAEDGNIAELVTAEHGSVKGDLFVDSTGFRRALIRRVDPRQRFESYSAFLFCDRAIVLRFPYQSDDSKSHEMCPYVRASAESAGWIWTIPLYNRISSGYVYSSAFISDDEAESELRRYWGYERTKDAIALKVRFEGGKLERMWVKNCVAIGLSGGFVEPLESTGLLITQSEVEILASVLDARYYDDFGIHRFNMHMQKICDDIRQFIVAHYCLTEREDTAFWKSVKYDTIIPEDVAARLEIFRELLPTAATKGLEEIWFFRDISWFSVLLGMNFDFHVEHVGDRLLKKAEDILRGKSLVMNSFSASYPVHYDFIKYNAYEPHGLARAATGECSLA